MEFEKVDLTLPLEIKEFYDVIYKTEHDSYIIGDFLLENYLELPSSHVDIFINQSSFHHVIENLINTFSVTFSDISLSNFTALFDFKGYKAQLIFVKEPSLVVTRMDIRARELYFQDNQAFASSDAKSDIENKISKIGIPLDPMKTYVRLYEFFIKLGFTIDEKSKNLLVELFNEEKYPARKMVDFIEKNTTGYLKEKLLKHFEKAPADNILHFPIEKTHRDAIQFLKSIHYEIKRDVFEKIYFKDNFFKEEVKCTFDEHPGVTQLRELQEEIKKEFKRQSIKINFYFPKEIKHWKSQLDDPTFLLLILPNIIEKLRNEEALGETYEKLREMYNELKNTAYHAANFDQETTLIMTNENCLYKGIDTAAYTNGEIVRLEIENNFAIINSVTNETLYTTMDSTKLYFCHKVVEEMIKRKLLI